jgi:hypothetical protein
MKGDFTRSTFKKENHYTSVRMQQGRVQMDADWNEQMDIQAHFDQTEAKDVIGRTGVPKYGGGFNVGILPDGSDLTISAGRIYVDGILCELEEPGTTYLTQPDFPGAPGVEPGDYLVYLDVWRRHITALEDGNIREKALGGPDTATRTKTLWQVKLQSADSSDCDQIDSDWHPDKVKKSGELSARAKPGEVSKDPCILPPQAGYRRLENQLYRVEIHKSGTAGSPGDANNATFKWSRDNGSIAAHVDAISGGEITVSYPVPGRLQEFTPGLWIELTDENHELKGEKGIFLEILEKKGEKLTVESSAEDVGWDPNDFSADIKIRRWDSAGALEVNIPADNDGFIPLEDGVEIKFETGKDYQTGDYWLIPARSATGDIEWPKDETSPGTPVFKAADGILHHYCQLALVEFTSGKFIVKQDCRDFFPPLNEITIGKGCCTVTVGDGKTSFGDVDSLATALGKVKQGGQICLLPGLHKANVTIKKGKNITIRGCGKQTIVIPLEEFKDQPIFSIIDSRFITLENMDIMTLAGTAIQVEKSAAGGLGEIEISGNRIIALKHAVRVDDEDGEEIKINGNRIRMVDREDGDAAFYMMAKNSIIEGNDILVVPAEVLIQYETDLESIYKAPPLLMTYMNAVWEYTLTEYPAKGFNAPGGIQVAGGSEGIAIKGNRVRGGYWNGITLGHIPLGPNLNADYDRLIKTRYGIDLKLLGNALEEFKKNFTGFITGIEIVENEIKYMGLNGIGVVNFFSLAEVEEMVTVDELTITGNIITKCLQQKPGTIEKSMSGEMAFAGIALADGENLIIRENRIEENGAGFMAPVCGVFIRHGERIDISDNHVLNNGPTNKEDLVDAAVGIGGGVVIAMSIGKLMTDLKEGVIPYVDGFPAVKIHDNIVTQPMGKALYIVAMGPVSVVGNHLVSRGIHPKVLFYPYLAGAVMIVNLGVSRDLFALALLSTIKGMAQSAGTQQNTTYRSTGTVYTSNGAFSTVDIAKMSPDFFSRCKNCDPATPIATTPGVTGTTADIPPKTGSIIEILVYLPTGSVLFSNNRTTMDLRSPEPNFAISSQLIASLDDISYAGNQSECNSRIDIVLTDVFTIGNTVRTNDNRFQEGFTIALYSLLSIGIMMNTWIGNQATNCLTAVGIVKETKGNNLVLYKNLFFDFIKVIKDKTFCELSRNALYSLVKPGQNPALPQEESD